MKTITDYIFSESLIIEDYEKVLRESKKINALKI